MTGAAWRRLALLAMALVCLRLIESITTWVPGWVGDLEVLAAGGHVWVSFYGGAIVPFSVSVAS